MSKKILTFDHIVSRSLVVRVATGEQWISEDDKRAKPIDVILDNPDLAKRVIDDLDLKMSPSCALQFIDNPSEDSEGSPKALRGISGVGVAPFLRAYDARIEKKNSEFRVKVGGKACDFVFIPDPFSSSDRPDTGTGHLSVDVLHEYFESDESLRNCKPDQTDFYHWDIKIKNFTVHKRYDLIEEYKNTPEYFPDTPFPSLPDAPFPAHTLDPDDSRSIWCRCLDHKLLAMGDEVEIEHVYRQICHESPQIPDENFHLLDRNDPRYKGYYESTEETCVDIMFKGYPPLAGLPEQREYCLGRCKHPDIVNTGA